MKMTPQEFANKADYEGGIYEAFLWGYPELATESDELRFAYTMAKQYHELFVRYERDLQNLLPDPSTDWPEGD